MSNDDNNVQSSTHCGSYEANVVIMNERGLHVRPAAGFAQLANTFTADIEVVKDGKVHDGKNGLDLLTLEAIQGNILTIRARGEDSEGAVEALVRYLREDSVET